MYIVTFYSFKGGVGRTMALANVAFDLANRGKNVLVVDFDLEAPGLNAFLEPHGAKSNLGLVDFVTDYRLSGQPPDVADYIYQVESDTSVKPWFMPAGKSGHDYGSKLHSIDWRKLYEKEDGYLLFEDLKVQWKKTIDPDYVLIDSRTGHTDVGGICTRQLPDAVTLLFRLDHQNLEGLARVSTEIRREGTGSRGKQIKLHFVPSNIPRLDDEHNVVKDQITKFRETLEIRDRSVQIQHYEDLGLLTHSIHTLDRPNSRLANQYHKLTDMIVTFNLEDNHGAKNYLNRVLENRRFESAESIESNTNQILANHRNDHEILKLLADLRGRQGKLEQAASYLTEALESGVTNATYLLRRAELYQRLGLFDKTAADLRSILKIPVDGLNELFRVINLAKAVDDTILNELPSSAAIKSLQPSEIRVIAHEFLTTPVHFQLAIEMLTDLMEDTRSDDFEFDRTISTLSLSLIGAGKFDRAIKILSGKKEIDSLFNFCMADWGLNREPSPKLFNEFLSVHDESGQALLGEANYEFCLALAFRAVDRRKEAMEHLQACRNAMEIAMGDIFSPWRYWKVRRDVFIEDINDASSKLLDDDFTPLFVTMNYET